MNLFLRFVLILSGIVIDMGECTMGRITMKSSPRALSHSVVRSLIRSHLSVIRLLRTIRFGRSLTLSQGHGKEVYPI